MIGTLLLFRISRQTSYPSIPGSIISSNINCGLYSLNFTNACSPSPTISVSKHSFNRYSEINSAIFSSSSTIKIRFFSMQTSFFPYRSYGSIRLHAQSGCYSIPYMLYNSTIVTPASPSPNSPNRKDFTYF